MYREFTNGSCTTIFETYYRVAQLPPEKSETYLDRTFLKTFHQHGIKAYCQDLFTLAPKVRAILSTVTVISSRTSYGTSLLAFPMYSSFCLNSASIFFFPYGSTISSFYIACTVYIIEVLFMRQNDLIPCLMCTLKWSYRLLPETNSAPHCCIFITTWSNKW